MRAKALATLLAVGFVSSGSAYAGTQDGGSRDISKINTSIVIDDGGRAGELESVNGRISIGNNADVESAETVNGSVRIGNDSRSQTLSTVNGSVSVGQRTIVAGDVTSVNGRLTLDDEAVVQGNAQNVNSAIVLGRRAHITGKIVTSNGDVTLQENARVDGGIKVKEVRSHWFSNFFGESSSRRPIITIGPGVQVGGELVFERDVELRVHATATIGPVHGASIERY